MSVSKWAYDPEVCDPAICPGDCDLCDVTRTLEKYEPDEDEQEILSARKGEE